MKHWTEAQNEAREAHLLALCVGTALFAGVACGGLVLWAVFS